MAIGISPWVAQSAEYRPDRYYTYAHLTEMLNNWAREYPEIMTIESIGISHEGRDIWAVTLTNPATGHHSEKPATFVDSNIHAGEVTGQAAVLWLLNHMLKGYGTDDVVTRAMDTSTLYAIPGIMLDGIEMYLTTPERMRSSVRNYPVTDETDGLQREDLDGDGRILQMRVVDAAGAWKKHPEDERVMVRRTPDEFGDDYYSVYEEGSMSNWNGGKIDLTPEYYGLDLNRNFPLDWKPEWDQKGAGEFPLSEPETRALSDFLLAHENIGTSQHFHTWSAVILRPGVNIADDDMDRGDLAALKAIGKMGEDETGYPCISIHHDFNYDRRTRLSGSVTDWVYSALGILAYATELWSLPARAGVKVTDFINWGKERPDSDDLAMARVLDEHAEGEGLFAWKPFDHPQLGNVEIGGWDYKFAMQNPPGPLLEEVTKGNALFVLREMGVLPHLAFDSTKVEPIGSGVYKVSAVLINDGYLPTYVSSIGKKNGRAKAPKLTLSGAKVATGKPEVTIDHLEGRLALHVPMGIPYRYGNLARGYAEWVVTAKAGDEIQLTATANRAGTVKTTVTVPAE